MRRLGSKDRFRPIRGVGWASNRDAALNPSAETIAAVEQFERRKQPRCVAPTVEAVQGKSGDPSDLHPNGRITDEARDPREESE